MKYDWNAPLKPDMKSNPIEESTVEQLTSDCFYPEDATLAELFSSAASLKTWGRANGQLVGTPHWIAVHRDTPLHTDPAYPRYSHQLIVRADDGFVLRGHDKIELPIKRGTLIRLDTHSPHQLFNREGKKGYYIGASMDMHEALPLKVVRPILMSYIRTAAFLTDEAKSLASKSAKR